MRALPLLLVVASPLLAAACASIVGFPDVPNPEDRDSGLNSGGRPGSASRGVDSSADSASSGTDANLSEDAFAGCATSTELATKFPLDLYFLLDTSGSMDDLVGPQQSKWNDVVSALMAFVNDPASAGIGVGLQYFPLTASGVPTSCTSSSQCGSSGPCFLNACDLSGTQNVLEPCDTSADCAEGVACSPIGLCSNDHNTSCPLAAGSCGNDANGFALGTCQAVSVST